MALKEMQMCPAWTSDGKDCWNTPHPDSRLGLCMKHWQKAVEDWRAPAVERRIRCRECGQLTLMRSHGDNFLYCANRDCARVQFEMPRRSVQEMDAEREQWNSRYRASTVDVVYYIRWADRIKIGTSQNLKTRMGVLYHDEILALELGDVRVEHARHAQFDHLRLPRYKEWFSPGDDLVAHINSLRLSNGEPWAAHARWITEKKQQAA